MPAQPGAPALPGAHVELDGVWKSFGGVRALQAASLRIERGTIHALVGENGAGKSTIGKIIAGVLAPDGGRLLLRGVPVRFHSPREAIAAGITLIAQELSVAPALSVAENVFLGVEPGTAGLVRSRTLLRDYAQLSAAAGFDLSGEARAGGLRTADQQKVEILRALGRNAELIVMDEPTAALSRPDVVKLHEVIRRLAAAGTTIVLVSHFLGEVLELADVVTVLRDGQVVRTMPAAGQTEESLLALMLGASGAGTYPRKRPALPDARVALAVDKLSGPGFADISLALRVGEVVGMAGLIGAGRTELARAVYRALRVSGGSVVAPGGRLLVGRSWLARRADSPRTALRAGLAMIPESRKEQGLLLGRSVRENVTLASLADYSRAGFVGRTAERRAVAQMLTRLDIRAASQNLSAGALSGGNQQKLLFARMLLCSPRVLIADEPTRGVDVGAKRAIYELLASLAGDGMAVLLISSDIEEILGLAHRVLVMRQGRIAAELSGEQLTEAAILAAAFGAGARPGDVEGSGLAGRSGIANSSGPADEGVS
ncbi:MAG TPA: sugar ABC transporter ATP-binding protein [Streptosporangiaceae bacterium]|nr:sugar ABC transporter ATP-binding protein [Streptosporangiaceae bacterium]